MFKVSLTGLGHKNRNKDMAPRGNCPEGVPFLRQPVANCQANNYLLDICKGMCSVPWTLLAGIFLLYSGPSIVLFAFFPLIFFIRARTWRNCL